MLLNFHIKLFTRRRIFRWINDLKLSFTPHLSKRLIVIHMFLEKTKPDYFPPDLSVFAFQTLPESSCSAATGIHTGGAATATVVAAAVCLDLIREKYVPPILIVSIRIGLEPSFPISISQMMLNLVKVLMKITPFEITTVIY